MLEAAILLQLGLGDYLEAGVVTFLLMFNAGLGFVQEGRAKAPLDALKSRLALVASVRREWLNVASGRTWIYRRRWRRGSYRCRWR